MNLKEFCLTLPKAVEDYPFGPVPIVIKVHNKMFALIKNEGEISLKCEPIIALEYRDMFKAVNPGYHLNKKHWNTVKTGMDVNDDIIKIMIIQSYRAVLNTLVKKDRNQCLSLLNK